MISKSVQCPADLGVIASLTHGITPRVDLACWTHGTKRNLEARHEDRPGSNPELDRGQGEAVSPLALPGIRSMHGPCHRDIRITHALPEDGPRSGPVRVGWFLIEERGGVIYDAPARVRSAETSRRHAKSADSRCPAVLGLESRYFEVKCPFDLGFAFATDKDGKPAHPQRPRREVARARRTNSPRWFT